MEKSQSYILNPWDNEEERRKSCLLCQGELGKKYGKFILDNKDCLSCGVINHWFPNSCRAFIEIAQDIDAEIWWKRAGNPHFFLSQRKVSRLIYNEHWIWTPTKDEIIKRGIKVLKMLNFL